MKTLLVILSLAALPLSAQVIPNPSPNPPAPPPQPREWWRDVVVAPFGSVSHTDFQGKGTWGAGIDLGYYINKTVSLHVSNLGTEENDWRGEAIDETSLLFHADLIRDSRERFVGYLLGGVDRYWSLTKVDGKCVDPGWGLGVGAGGEIRITKNFSFGVDYRVRLREEGEFGSIGRGFLKLGF